MQVVILAALLPEARAFARAFHLSGDLRPANRYVANDEIRICLIGPRARGLAAVPREGVRGVIMAGLAGALAPELAVGDIVIQGAMPVGHDLPYKVHCGKLMTAQGIVAGPAEKAALFRDSGALAVDMETAHAQRWAESLAVPFLAVRAVSDTAQETLDPELLSFVDEDGRPRLGRAMKYLALHPTNLPALLQIRHATNAALSRLAATLGALLRTGWPG